VAHPGPQFSVQDVYDGWVSALRGHGQHVITYNFDDRLSFLSQVFKETASPGVFQRALTTEQAIELAADGLNSTLYKVWPDVLLVISGFFITKEILDRARRSRTRIVIVHTETPYETQRQLAIAQYADVNLVNDPTGIEQYQAVAPTYYVPHAYRPSIHHPGDPTPKLECDLGFVGTGYQSRIQFLESMDLDGLDVLLGGNWQALDEESPLRQYVGHDLESCMDNTETADVYRSARVGLNLYRREAERPELSTGWALGPREIEMAACEAFFLRDRRGEGDEVLSMLPTFESPEEASDLLRHWLVRPDERAALARQARLATEDRTFANHAAMLLRLLDA
jgi:spore maturation protein CgeB